MEHQQPSNGTKTAATASVVTVNNLLPDNKNHAGAVATTAAVRVNKNALLVRYLR